MVILISRAVRQAVKSALAASFNTAASDACTEFGIDPFSIDFDEPGKSYFETKLGLEDMVRLEAPESWPAMSVFVDGTVDDSEQISLTWSGRVQVTLRGFMRWPDADVTDTESLADAFEAAVVGSLFGDADLGEVTLLRGTPMSRSDLIWIDGAMYQQCEFTLAFQIDVQ